METPSSEDKPESEPSSTPETVGESQTAETSEPTKEESITETTSPLPRIESLLVRPFQDAEIHLDCEIGTMVVLPYGRVYTNNHNVNIGHAIFCGFSGTEAVKLKYGFGEKAWRGIKRLLLKWLVGDRFTLVSQRDYVNALMRNGTHCAFCQNPFDTGITKDEAGNVTIKM